MFYSFPKKFVLRIPTPSRNKIFKRWLNIYEYEAKSLMEKYKVRVQKGEVAATGDEARRISKRLLAESSTKLIILKAQVLAGGRGRGTFEDGFKGGIHLIKKAEDAQPLASKMLNKKLITKQTGSNGEMVSKLLVLDGLNFEKELYFAILLDRESNGPVMVGSPMGGMDIEEVARTHPNQLLKIPIDYLEGLTNEKAEQMISFLGIHSDDLKKDAIDQLKALYALFKAEQATQIEINPLVVANDDKAKPRVFCVDAKLNFDDNAPTQIKTATTSKEDPRMAKARANNLSFIPLDGTIGCMVNGAGLAMATMDIIKLKGGSPANFLDVGGSASESQVTAAFELIASDKRVKAILVNIFGGIMRCDVIASGIVNAMKTAELKVPLIVRLEGTMAAEGREILSSSKLPIKMAAGLDDAAEKAVLFSK